MDDFAKKCIEDHRNPLKKLRLPAQKLLLKMKNETFCNEYEKHYENVLSLQRVDKRLARAQAIWQPNKQIFKITKVVKNLVKYFGFQNKDGIFMHPEEVLFLLETNRLEVIFDEHYLTLEKAYDLILKTTNINLAKYKIFKKLALLGYKLIRFEENNETSHIRENNAKRSFEAEPNGLQSIKRIKIDSELDTVQNISRSNTVEVENLLEEKHSIPLQSKGIIDIMNKVKRNMPKCNNDYVTCLKPDYCVFTPSNSSNLEPDFYLFVCKDNVFNWEYKSKLPCAFASCTDDVVFYRSTKINVPFIAVDVK